MTTAGQRRTVVLLFVVFLLSLVARGQEAERPVAVSETVERSGVALLLLDVVVTDDSGAPIRRLTPQDFSVQLNSREWPIYSLDDLCQPEPVETVRAATTSTDDAELREPETPANPPTPAVIGKRFVLYFDFSQLQIDGRNRAFEAARRWTRKTKRSDDAVSVVGYSELAGLQELCPFTTDQDEVLAALDTAESDPELIGTFAPSVRSRMESCLPCVSKRCDGDPPQCVGRYRRIVLAQPCWTCCPKCVDFAQSEQAHGQRSLRALQVYLESLETIPGRKALLLFQQNSMTFPGRIYGVDEIKAGDNVSLMDRVGAEATLANAAIYSAAVGDQLGQDPVVEGSVNFGANLAGFTGGDFGRGLTDLGDLLDRAGRGERCVYRIGLRQLGAPGGVPIRAKVWVRDKPLAHRYPVQFLGEVDRWWRAARAAVRDPESYTDVGVTAAIVPVARSEKGWDLSLRVAVDVETLTLLPRGGGQGAQWEVGALLSRNDGSRTWEMLARSELLAGEATAAGTILHEQWLSDLGPGEYHLAAFVRDLSGNTFGASEATLEIPAPKDRAVLGPILLKADHSYITSPLPRLAEKKTEAIHSVERSTGAVPMDGGAIPRGVPLQIESWVCGQRYDEILRFISEGEEALFRFDGEATPTADSCRHVVDRVETVALEPGRYTYHLRVLDSVAAEFVETEVALDVSDHTGEPPDYGLLEALALKSPGNEPRSPADTASTQPDVPDLAARAVHLSDLPAEIRRAVGLAVPEASGEGELLSAIDLLVPKRRFESDVVTIVTDLRWYAEPVDGDPRGPIALLHRWPGDTVLALYALDPGFDKERPPPLPTGTPPVRMVDRTGSLEWHGSLSTELGEQPWSWIVRNVGDDLPRLGALLLPGDAGLGSEATPGLMKEARWVAERVEVREPGWGDLGYVGPGQPVVIPEVREVPGETDERSEPWRTVPAHAFTIGLPPGLRAMRLDAGIHVPEELSTGVLWFRGRFEDIEGSRVVVGDGIRAGYVARLEASAKAWRTGKQAPLGAPDATRIASSSFKPAAKWTGARSATAERWSEEGFDGEWLIFRLAFKDEGYEIGLPVLEGRQSASLFWIALTWRPAGLPPAPPPYDLEHRFGIRFQPAIWQTGGDQVVLKGTLEVPGMRLRVPEGVQPAPALYSDDGYPIRFVSRDGTLVGTLTFVDKTDAAAFVSSLSAFVEEDVTGRPGADRILAIDDGKRLFVTTEGDIYCFQPGPSSGASGETDDGPAIPERNQWAEIVASVRLVDES